MRIVRDDEGGRISHLLMFESELCEQLDVSAEQLRSWTALYAPVGQDIHPERETREAVYQLTREDLDRFAQYAKILKTGMSVKQVQELESRDRAARRAGKRSNFVEMYAILADECPPGVTAHALRSFSVLFLYQNRGGRMLLSADLARAAGIPEDTALRHIKYLQATGLLKLAENPPRWEFGFVPKALSRYYPS